MNKILVIETYFNKKKQKFYYVVLPSVREEDFYRAVSSFNAFFNSMRNPKANVTEIRQFTADHEDGIEIRKKFLKDINWNNLKTFKSIWDFYKFIGYDYKTRKYKSGEVMKSWDGRYFVLKKRNQNVR